MQRTNEQNSTTPDDGLQWVGVNPDYDDEQVEFLQTVCGPKRRDTIDTMLDIFNAAVTKGPGKAIPKHELYPSLFSAEEMDGAR
jgi:hypothetical protein